MHVSHYFFSPSLKFWYLVRSATLSLILPRSRTPIVIKLVSFRVFTIKIYVSIWRLDYFQWTSASSTNEKERKKKQSNHYWSQIHCQCDSTFKFKLTQLISPSSSRAMCKIQAKYELSIFPLSKLNQRISLVYRFVFVSSQP